ncbi:M48 family metalloprotease [Shimia thalassica]|uniref:M48 family metalloprotease n=1 Tax=Shimia thalassica TaxID=1715693 RepID=UPI00273730D6|nr:M48 family metalloprotease [Shimia thalassica]MDP2580638.1 M48 family metalloprotease [Shimia thalassica]
MTSITIKGSTIPRLEFRIFFVPIVAMTFHRETIAPSMRLHQLFLVGLLALVIWLMSKPAWAVSLIRDPDIEHALQQVAQPVLSAAGLGGSVKILVVNDNSLNAFVLDQQHIYIHLGMLMKMENAGMLQAVIAHEAAHIRNGHIARRIANLGTARSAAGLGTALALAVAAATGNAAAAGIALGAQSAAERRFLAHTRAEEASADNSGARFMTNAHIDPEHAVDVHKLFRGQELLNVSRQDPYVRSHPLTRDRIRAMEAFANAYKGKIAPQPEADYWFIRAKAKALAFTRAPNWTLRKVSSIPYEDVRLMAKAAAYLRLSDREQALSNIDAAIALRPKDAFFYELKGQILSDTRQFQAAVPAYKKAAELAPNNALCLAGYGHALLTAGQTKEALAVLEAARSRDFRNARLLRDLGSAYAKEGQNGMASLAVAERYALQGRLKDAEIHAKRASALLPTGSGAWRRAEDIVKAAKRARTK